MRNWPIWLAAGLVFSLSSHLNPVEAQQRNDIVSYYKAAITHVVLARDHTPTGQLLEIAQPTTYDGHPGRDFTGTPVTSLVVSIEYQGANPSDTMAIRLYPDNGGPEDQVVVRSCEFPLYPASGAKGCRLCFPVRGDHAISNSTSLPPGKYLIGIYVNEISVLKASFRVKTPAQPSASCAPGAQTFAIIESTEPRRTPTSMQGQVVTKVTSLACKTSNAVVNFRTAMNLDYPTLSAYNEVASKMLNAKPLPLEYRGLLKYPSLWGTPNAANFFLYTFYLLTFTNADNPDHCTILLAGTRSRVINTNDRDEVSFIDHAGDHYWIRSDVLTRN